MATVTPTDEHQNSTSPNFEAIKHGLVAMNSVFLIVTLWVISSMILHGRKESKWTMKTHGGRLYIFCFVSVLVGLPKLILFYFQLYVSNLPDWESKCEPLNDTNVIFSSFLLYLPYYFLWYRQKIFSSHPILQSSRSKIPHILSWGYLVYITLVFVVVSFAAALPTSTSPRDGDCFTMKVADDRTAVVVSSFVISSIVFMQLSLLGLFIYPMIKVKLALRGVMDRSSDNRDVENTIRRSTIATLVTCAVHIAGHTLGTVVSPAYPNVITGVFFHVAAFITMFCLLATFADFAKMLTVLCPQCSKTNQAVDSKVLWHKNTNTANSRICSDS